MEEMVEGGGGGVEEGLASEVGNLIPLEANSDATLNENFGRCGSVEVSRPLVVGLGTWLPPLLFSAAALAVRWCSRLCCW